MHRGKRLLRVAIGTALMLIVLNHVPVTIAATDTETALLKRGEIVVNEVPTQAKNGTRQLLAKVLIDRPLEQVWQVLSKQDKLFQGDPHMKKVRVVKRPSPMQEFVEYTLSISRFLPTFVYTTQVDYSRPANKIHFHRVSGSFKEFEGFCQLAPAENGRKTLLSYGLQVDIGFLIPPFVVRQVLKKELPNILTHVENQVYQQFPAKVAP